MAGQPVGAAGAVPRRRAGEVHAVLLKYQAGDWNVDRNLNGDLVFPPQAATKLNNPGVDHTGGEFLLDEQRPVPSPEPRPPDPARARPGLHHP